MENKAMQIEYNLPGYGKVNCLLFPFAKEFLDFLEKYSHITRLMNTNQLGTMRYIFPGAHHTRYEYVFLQIMMISNIKTNRSTDNTQIEIGLGTDFDAFGTVASKKPTGGEILQILAIASNAGHLQDTFTSARIFLHYLLLGISKSSDSNPFYSAFKRGLPNQAIELFDETLKNKNYYHMQYFFMLFMLNRYAGYSAKNKDSAYLGIRIICSYLNRDKEQNDSVGKLWRLYDAVRRISYLSLDMNYTPVPLTLNISSLIMNIPNLLDDIFNSSSNFNNTLTELNSLINNQIYNSSNCIIANSCLSDCICSGIKIENLRTIDSIAVQLSPLRKVGNQSENVFCSDPIKDKLQRPWIRETELRVIHDANIYLDCEDLIIAEKKKRVRIGLESCYVGIQAETNMQSVTVSYAIQDRKNINRVSTALKIISDAVRDLYHKNSRDISDENNKNIMVYVLKILFSFDVHNYLFIPVKDKDGVNSFFWGRGTKAVAKQIENFAQKKENEGYDKDKLHEIRTTARALENESYSGMVICYVGDTKIYSKVGIRTPIDEIDGIVFFPNSVGNNAIGLLIEAKNYSKGQTDAIKQLQNTIDELSQDLKADTRPIYGGAYASVYRKKI